jgi:hypothetical protein
MEEQRIELELFEIGCPGLAPHQMAHDIDIVAKNLERV